MTYIVSSGALNSTPTPTSTRWTQQGRHAATIRLEQELDLENEVSPTVAQPPGTLFLPTSTTLLTPVPSENDSRVYFMIVLTTDYCWRIAAPYKFHVDWLIDCRYKFGKNLLTLVASSEASMRRAGVCPSVRPLVCPVDRYLPAPECSSGQRLTVRSVGRASTQTCF